MIKGLGTEKPIIYLSFYTILRPIIYLAQEIGGSATNFDTVRHSASLLRGSAGNSPPTAEEWKICGMCGQSAPSGRWLMKFY